MLAYIEATLLHGYTKKDAYLEFIDPASKNPTVMFSLMEKKKEFKDLYAVIYSDDQAQIMAKANTVRLKYVKLMEQNIDLMSEVMTEAKKTDGLREKATAVRLANETISAMAIVSGNGQPADGRKQPKLDAGGIIS